jgi:YVTN family beta-propeller protein
MKKLLAVSVVALAGLYVLSTKVNAQRSSAPETPRPLILTEAIPLEGVKGRIDHFGSAGNRLFVSALGNNTVEVIDISARTVVHTITGIPNPQGVAFSPEANKLFAASSKGKLYIYDGTSFDLIKEIDFHSDVDNLRYDAANKRVYVGYGEDETGAIGTVDATTNERLGEEYKLGAHPESFQLETSGPNIYANLPDLKQIAVINRSTHAISRWPLTLQMNFPMALDESRSPLIRWHPHPGAAGGVRHELGPHDRRASMCPGHRRPLLRCRAQTHLCGRRRGIHQCFSTEGCGSLPAFVQDTVGIGRPNGRIFWQRKKGRGPLLPGSSSAGGQKRRNADLYGTRLKHGRPDQDA